MHTIECVELPETPDLASIYRLIPNQPDDAYYRERTDRNIGWIRPSEQETLKKTVMGVAGCGGMGGRVIEAFVRAGVGEIRFADCEVFDVSNIGRQLGATRNNVGVSKALATARMIRDITDDTTLVVYPQGITEETVDEFLDGCDVVLDEIELYAIASRLLLHKRARGSGIPLFVCSTVGFGARLMRFMPKGTTMEACVSLTYEEAVRLQERVQNKTASMGEVAYLLRRLTTGLVPGIHGYAAPNSSFDDYDFVMRRLHKEYKAPILSTNPILAAGLLADHVLLYLLRETASREVIVPPEPPGYLYLDAARMHARIVDRSEAYHER